ncbi:MAG: glycosyltransferase family 2 protein [Cyanobacteria bacterium SIG31]|nr:glycosyltransferase family 2 protein [Cyanobacteria bacterium SIG31]
MVKVSIVVPVYNCEPFLAKCLDSILGQTLKEIEVICVNDGSTDSSLEILQEYASKDSRMMVIDKTNEGQAVARNIAIEHARGEFLGFVDADDWVDLDYFEKLYQAAKKNNCDVACAGFKRFKKNKERIADFYEAELVCTTTNDKVRLANIPAHNYIWNKIYNREAWVEAGIKFQSGRYYEDMALLIKIIHKMKKMVTVPDVYYIYRLNPTSTCAQKTNRYSADYRWALGEMFRYADENDIILQRDNIIHKKIYYKIFNFTLLKIYYYESLKIYKLFGFIPFGRQITV